LEEESMSTARHHAEWLSLVEASGPFLSMPVLLQVFPNGLEAHDSDQMRMLRSAHEEWQDNQQGLRPEPAIHRAWVEFVLKETLGFLDEVLLTGQAIPAGLQVVMAEHQETLRPDWVVVNLSGTEGAGKLRLLVQVLPAEQGLEKGLKGSRWAASPATRMMELLHASGVRLGLVTNGEHWMLVNAPKGETTGYISWYSTLWQEEQITLRAFRSLLGIQRFFSVDEPETLEAMLAQSVNSQQEVTDQLGYQVRKAVEVLVQSIDRIDQDRNRALLHGISETRLYEAALTVMMRLVFLFSAEERGLLLLGDPLYDQFYAVSTLRSQLREQADQHGEEILERRHDAWSRLLATFRAVHTGVQHEAMQLPAYGGTLFDPDRFPFLEGRREGTGWKNTAADPIPVNNRTVLHLLEALQILQVKVPGGRVEPRKLSFRSLDIEQIGHVYEGLLDHTAVRAKEPILGLMGTKDKEKEISLAELERLVAKGEADLINSLKEETGKSLAALKKALSAEIKPQEQQRLRTACSNAPELFDRVMVFAGLVRQDTLGYPVVIPAGSVYVTEGVDRRQTGTHYTPRNLTEEIVQYTLEPLVYEGPAEGKPKEEWRLRSAAELLQLKVCDIAMGSGAFLVQTCRYLAERLVEAWEVEVPPIAPSPTGNEGQIRILPDGSLSLAELSETLLPSEPPARLMVAQRLVADRCLYGVDKNPLAVEMAKLSLWLITLAKGRPFTFLDHALKCGDSLLGLTRAEQIEYLHLNPDNEAAQYPISAQIWRPILQDAIEKRRKLESFSTNFIQDLQEKEKLFAEAEQAIEQLRFVGDYLIGRALADTGKTTNLTTEELMVVSQRIEQELAGTITAEQTREITALKASTQRMLNLGNPANQPPRRPFHWLLEFPEVFLPSPPAPLPEVEGSKNFDGDFSKVAGRYRQIPSALLQRAKELRQQQTPAEQLLWECLRDHQLLNKKFRRQHNLDRFIADFYCHEAKLVIELDGKIHETQVDQDANRDEWMRSQGLTVLRFTNEAVFNSPDQVLEAIASVILPPSTSGRGAGGEGKSYRKIGFDAIVGNPPFQGGQKITGALGTDYRNFLVNYLAQGQRGSADLCAYFFLQANRLTHHSGGFGLVATNTIAQGDTREVGLDQLLSMGCVIHRAVPSRPWVGIASLEVAHIWLCKEKWNGEYVLDEKKVSGITALLTEPGQSKGNPFVLLGNQNKSFNGSKVYGQGFVLTPEEAEALIQKNSLNKDVLFPYLNGEDLNSRPDQSPSRWVINFKDYPLDAEHDDPKKPKGAPYAADYPDCLAIVREKVKPERDKNNRKLRRERWWQYGEIAPGLYEAIEGCDRVLATAAVSPTTAFHFAPTDIVYAHKLIIIVLKDASALAILQSTFHREWAYNYSSTLGGVTLNYSPSDCFETFPFPTSDPSDVGTEFPTLNAIGETYYTHRQTIMQTRKEGLTKTYNRFHDPNERSIDIQKLRDLHIEMDNAVAAAYGWQDLDLEHDFHPTKQGIRFTISETTRREVLDRLLELNHQRYAEEVAQGLHDKKKAKGKAGSKKKAVTPPDEIQESLF
jgi:very-short-patch-repair endonuclease